MQDYEYIIHGGIGSRGSWLLCDMGTVPYVSVIKFSEN